MRAHRDTEETNGATSLIEVVHKLDAVFPFFVGRFLEKLSKTAQGNIIVIEVVSLKEKCNELINLHVILVFVKEYFNIYIIIST